MLIRAKAGEKRGVKEGINHQIHTRESQRRLLKHEGKEAVINMG